MAKDKRFKTIKLLIENGGITRLGEIPEHIPVTTIAKSLGTNYPTLTKYFRNPKLLTIEKILRMASFFEVDEKVMIDLVYKQIVENRPVKKRRN